MLFTTTATSLVITGKRLLYTVAFFEFRMSSGELRAVFNVKLCFNILFTGLTRGNDTVLRLIVVTNNT